MDTIPGVDLTASHYTIKQSLIRNRYEVRDPNGDVVLQAKQKLLKLKEEIPFRTPAGRTVFTVRAEQVLDVAGDYAVETPRGDTVAVLEKKFILLKHRWRIRHPDTGEVLALLESGNSAIELARNLHPVLSILPHRYTITSPDGEPLGTLQGKLSIRDTYLLKIMNTGRTTREVLVAASVAVDVLEGN